jgi:hypothetical protein
MAATKDVEKYDFDIEKIAKDFLVDFCDENQIKIDLFEGKNKLYLSSNQWIAEVYSCRDKLIDPDEDYVGLSIPLIIQAEEMDLQNKVFAYLLEVSANWNVGRLMYHSEEKFFAWNYIVPCSKYDAKTFEWVLRNAMLDVNKFNEDIKREFPEVSDRVINSWEDVDKLHAD